MNVRLRVCAHCALGATALLLVLNWTAPRAAAWGSTGHSHITGGAIPHLPQPLRSFFEANVSTIRSQASQEPPGRHYIDIDVYPEFAAGTFPHDVNVLIAKYGASYVEQNGRGPWTYADYVQSLTTLMSNARTKQDWLNLIPTAAAQAHYIEDMHNPLHLTQNYDGQLSGNNGVHSRYESSMISRKLSNLTFSAADAEFQATVIDDVFDSIDIHYQFVDDIMAADTAARAAAGSYNTAYYDSMWSQTGDFTRVLFQEASEAVADGWYTAWVNAGSPIPNLGLTGDYNGDNVIDAGDYTAWRDAVGVSPNPLVNDPTPATVDESDFTYWKEHFGQSIGGFSAATAVPEPAAVSLLFAAAIAGSAVRRRRFSFRARLSPRSCLHPGTHRSRPRAL
ncbi:MAG: PEP-CTERM sorting domain-containing protein [Pirellulales bacterium]